MPLNASIFIQNRSKVISITNDRINHILWYVIECYQMLQKDMPIYSKSWIRLQTTHKPEDYLKMEFVDKYLIPNKSILKHKISALEQINFTYETQKRYVDAVDGKEKPDKIDIYINKLGLQNEWNKQDEDIYFAIECKRIEILSDTKDYISDINKYTLRNHTNLRLPFEGMIAFIENKNLNHSQISNEVNKRLNTATNITTTKSLNPVTLHEDYNGTYSSSHKKTSFQFSIYFLTIRRMCICNS